MKSYASLRQETPLTLKFAPDGILLAQKGVNLKKGGAMKREHGFTMLELLITIVILCILMGLAIPGFSSWLPKYRLRGAVRDIYSNLQYAKMVAVKDRARCGVLFDVANNQYRVVGSGTNRTF